MKNPKSFSGATPYDYSSVIDHSTSGRSAGANQNSRGHQHPKRSWSMTSPTHSAPTPASAAIDAIPSGTKSHPGVIAKMPMSSGFVGDGKQMKAPMSGAMNLSSDPVDSRPKSWKRGGYSTAGGHSLGDMKLGKARKKP